MIGQNKEQRGSIISKPWMSLSLRTGNTNPSKRASSHRTCPFAVFPASLLWCRSRCHRLSGPVSQHTANVLTHRLLWLGSHLRLRRVCQGLKAACAIWAACVPWLLPRFRHPDLFSLALLLQVEGEFSPSAYKLYHRRFMCHLAPIHPLLTLLCPMFTENYHGCFFLLPLNVTLLRTALSVL